MLLQYSIGMERPEGIPENLQQSQIGCIFGTALISAACHFIRPNPSAGEATRGYLHGGLIIDFVGQLGPTPKFQLLLLDLAILLLHLLLVRTVADKRHWHDRHEAGVRKSSASRNTARQVALEEHDVEEQGTSAAESRGDGIASTKDSFDVDLLHSGLEALGPFWILEQVTESHHRLSPNQPTSALSNILSMDLRRRQYSLNLPSRR
jgi:Fungal domain of unknown function (DUF1746)